MKSVFSFIGLFYKEINKPVFAASTLLAGSMIFLNYHFHIDEFIDNKNSVFDSFYYRYLIFLTAFAIPYFSYYLFAGKKYLRSRLVLFLIIISPAIFSWKIAMNTGMQLSDDLSWNYYWNQIIYWPVRLVVMSGMLFILWFIFYRKESFFGLTIQNFKWKPYLLMLLIMVPLIAAASTQPDFLAMYPKLKDVNSVLAGVDHSWIYKIIHELAYGTDFISVELFFRGFLVLAFVKVVGKDAILPMACFYCTIHFGKPLGECISSYFGGMLLGIVVFHTRSIIGGLMVHLGIAWLMELGGYIGNSLK
jgi:hypothetical protein